MIFKQYTLNGKRRVSNGKCHVIKRKQTREKVCGLCLNANSCILCCICLIVSYVVFVKNRFCHFRTFPWLLKKYAKSKQICRKFAKLCPPPPPPPFQPNFCHCSYAHKTTSYAHKTTSYAFKTYKFDS